MDWIRLLKAIAIVCAAALEFLLIMIAFNEDDDGATIACRTIIGVEFTFLLITVIYALIG